MSCILVLCMQQSFPTRERGLKSPDPEVIGTVSIVVPHAGTWIEMYPLPDNSMIVVVVPHAGTWIEIFCFNIRSTRYSSFPTRERGLKFRTLSVRSGASQSFPTRERGLKFRSCGDFVWFRSRSPRGNVD